MIIITVIKKIYPRFLLLLQTKRKYYISHLLSMVAGENSQDMSLKFYSLQLVDQQYFYGCDKLFCLRQFE